MPTTERTSTAREERKKLLTALQRVGRVIPTNSSKPILKGVRLEALGGSLHLSATDGDMSISVVVETEDLLPPCVVSWQELIKRVRASKADACSLRLEDGGEELIVNGGRVDHTMKTMDLGDFPAVQKQAEGQSITVEGLALRDALATALVGVAREPSRYAINGVLMESDAGLRLVATDGRRLVKVELEPVEREFRGRAILSARQATLVTKLIDRKSPDNVRVFIKEQPDKDGERQPSEVCFVGSGWLLKATEIEGRFPSYRDIVPRSQSKFTVARDEFIDTLTEVSTATNEESRAVQVELGAGLLTLTARAPGLAESTGMISAAFEGGGDSRIITGFAPSFLLDAVKTLPGERIVIDVGQNSLDPANNTVRGRPALLYAADSQRVHWVVMPVSMGLKPSRETLGSKFDGDGQAKSSVAEAPVEPAQAASPDNSNRKTPQRRRRRVEHIWPEIGTRLDGEYEGETYAALVVAAPKLKAGRALQIINGPAFGRVLNSMTAAMVAATAKQRQKLGTGKGKKGLPASGWEFWREPQLKQRMSA